MFKRQKIVRITISGFLTFGIIVGISQLLIIKKIVCHTQFGPCSNEFLEKLNYLKGRSIVHIPETDKVDQAFQNEPLYKSASIKRQFPNVLDVYIQMRIPVGAISNQDLKQFGLLDEDGKIISLVESTNMSILQIENWTPEIKQLAPLHVSSLKLLQKVGQVSKSSVIGQLTQAGLVVNSKQIPTIVIDPKSNADAWYSTLQVIIERSKIQNKMPTKIDLRFNQPVLEY